MLEPPCFSIPLATLLRYCVVCVVVKGQSEYRKTSATSFQSGPVNLVSLSGIVIPVFKRMPLLMLLLRLVTSLFRDYVRLELMPGDMIKLFRIDF